MLSREHVGWASTCNSIGQAFGIVLSNQLFIALSDPHWCHRFIGTPPGTILVSLPGFCTFWGWIFIFITIFVSIFKKEPMYNTATTNICIDIDTVHAMEGTSIDSGGTTEKSSLEEETTYSLLETYQQVISIFKLRPVQLLTIVQLTSRIGFAAADSVSNFKMQEYGM